MCSSVTCCPYTGVRLFPPLCDGASRIGDDSRRLFPLIRSETHVSSVAKLLTLPQHRPIGRSVARSLGRPVGSLATADATPPPLQSRFLGLGARIVRVSRSTWIAAGISGADLSVGDEPQMFVSEFLSLSTKRGKVIPTA